MDITIIIPTYKTQGYFEECLHALNVQTLDKSRYEVLIILNGEKKPYYKWIQELIDSYTFNSRLFYTNVPGVSNARNIGLDNAQGDYICFIDDDDYVSPSYLEELLAKASPDTISLCYPYAFNDGNPSQIPYAITTVFEKQSSYGRQRFSSKVRRYFNGPCMKLIPMSFIQGRRFNLRFQNGEDALFMFLISDRFNFVDFTSNKAIYYRRYRQNSLVTSQKTWSYIITNTLKLIGEYSLIFFHQPFSYSLILYFRSVCATAKTLAVEFTYLFNKKS